jgi:hypothetical protein
MHGHMNVQFVTMHGHMNVQFVTMHGHMNVQFVTMQGHMNLNKIVTAFVYSMLQDLRKNITFWKVPRHHCFVLLVRETYRWKWARHIGGMKITLNYI